MSHEEIVNEGIRDIIPIPKGTTTFRSFSNPRKNAKETDGDSQFREAVRLPTKDEVVKLIGIMTAVTVEQCMSQHFYMIGGDIQRL